MAVNSKDFQENGTQFYPVTHVESVIDGNGASLDSLLSAMQQSINNIYEALSLSVIDGWTTNDDYVPNSYAGNDVEDPRQVIPAGAMLVGVKLLSNGTAGTSSSQLRIYDNNRTLVKTINLGTIGATDTYVDLTEENITVQENYHYSIYRVGYKWVSGLSQFVNPSNGTAYSSSFYGFTFKYKYIHTKYDD